MQLPSVERGKMSFSGHERNHLFLNDHGHRFEDISGISGLDAAQDGRSFALWDFDRDGWQDIALANINTPVLSIYRNQMSSLGDGSPGRSNRMVALQFVGGNASDGPSNQYGCRDGYGAKASIKLPGRTLNHEHRCGEGLAAQNSSTMLFGLGENSVADLISVRWPSGKVQQIENVPSGEQVTFYENPADSPDGSGIERNRYIVEHGSSR